jgi:hypothetical protein
MSFTRKRKILALIDEKSNKPTGKAWVAVSEVPSMTLHAPPYLRGLWTYLDLSVFSIGAPGAINTNNTNCWYNSYIACFAFLYIRFSIRYVYLSPS